MKVSWHLQHKICLGSIVLSLLQVASCFSVQAVSLKQTATAKRFVDWCLNQEKLSPDAKHTVEVLLEKAGTTQCDRAENKLSTLIKLDLSSSQIADLRPLSSLSNLSELDLSLNQIADLTPLSSLTNLTDLDLSNPVDQLLSSLELSSPNTPKLFYNQIADLRPLSSLTKLTTLDLSLNQIADLRPLSSLTKLTTLDLSYNRITDLTPLSSLKGLNKLD
ncbi:MAG: leucine-rich repeat domain-containing protein, partial [Cyanobacteriota bacterium]